MLHFVLFGCIRDRLVVLLQCKTGRTSIKVRATKLRRNFSQRKHLIHPHLTLNCCFGALRTIWVYSGPFCCLMKLRGKRAELVQKFVPRNHVGIFPNKRTRSTPLDSKLTFWCVFRTIWVHSGPFGCLTKLGGKRAEQVQKVRATKSRQNFSQRTHPIQPIGP